MIKQQQQQKQKKKPHEIATKPLKPMLTSLNGKGNGVI